MIKNLIFDLAGVVMNLNITRDVAALNYAGFPCFEECCSNPVIRVPMLKFLNGLCSEEEFLRNIRPLCNPDATDDDIRWAMNAVLDDIPAKRIEMIIELRKRYKVYLLTNIYHYAWNHAVREIEEKGFGVNDVFDRVFLSYEMGLAKPDLRIYRKVIEETAILPEETIYFDDNKENIAAGKEMGFDSRLVEMNNLESLISNL